MELTALSISIIGLAIAIWALRITYKAYYYAKNANQETNSILKRQTDHIIEIRKLDKDQFKSKLRQELIENAVSDWRKRGTDEIYLKAQYDILKEDGWTKQDFEEIHKAACQIHKKRAPKRKLFD